MRIISNSKTNPVGLFLSAFLCAQAATLNAAELKIALPKSSHLQLSSQSYDLKQPIAKSSINLKGLALTNADLNLDGFPELIASYANGKQGQLAIHQGNEDAYSPSAAMYLEDLKKGIYPPGFKAMAQTIELPVAADLMVAEDFNADGDPDLVLAKKGDSALYFLAGSRHGFAKHLRLPQNGAIDALVAGEIDLPNAAVDLAVAISNKTGSSLLIYRDGISNSALRYALPAAVESIAIGKLDDNLLGDVVVLAGGQISILHGINQREAAPDFNRLETLSTIGIATSFALGDFIWDREAKTEIALMRMDGAVEFATRGALNTKPYTVDEVRALRRAQHAQDGKSAVTKSWQPDINASWKISESNKSAISKSMATKGALMFSAHFSGQASADLVVVDALNQALKLFTPEGNQRKSYTITATDIPTAALVMQTSAFALPSLIVLGDNARAPSVLPSVPKALFSTSKTTDTADGACNADCSLREAITAANSSPGADTILIGTGTYTLTIANAGGVNEDNNATGDLDIRDSVTLTGIGSTPRTIQAGSTNANGIDKVLAFNPICSSALTMSMSDLAVRFGRNTQPAGAPDFSMTGGGIDVCNVGAGGFSATNVVVDQNTNVNSYGGGINLDSVPGANGTYTLTNVTVTGNRTTATSGLRDGGGLNLYASAHNVSITNSNITANTSAENGGGIHARHTSGGAIAISGTTINSNIAASRGGGVNNQNLGVSTMTLNNDGFVQSNTSQGTTAGTESRGGGIHVAALATTTTTINEISITGNTANTGTIQGGGGIATTGTGPVSVTFSRIAGNIAGTGNGGGLHNNGATTTASSNWWGCNAGPTVAPCDRSNIVTGTATLTPRLQLAQTATPSTIVVGQTSALSANFLTDSGGAAVALANLDAMIGTTHAHNSPVLGTHSATQTSIQASGAATATFTATGVGAGSSNSVVDAQTQTVAITINKADTTTTITADTPDPSIVGLPVTVNFSVSVTAPGAGTPTGNVTVTAAGGAETCTGTVAAGTCSITLTAAGARDLTATYVGDANFNGSASAVAPHTVNALSVVSIAVAPASVSEDGATNLTYTVTRDLNLPTSTVVNITTGGTATSGTDYSGGVASVTIAANTTNANITIDPTSDTMVEVNETVTLDIATGSGYIFGSPSSVTGTINNDDTASVAITQSGGNTTVTEGGATDTYTVVLNAQPNANVTITLTPDVQLTASPNPLTFTTANWNVPQTVTVAAVDDTNFEPTPHNGMITHVASGGGYTGVSIASINANITDNDLIPVDLAVSNTVSSANLAPGQAVSYEVTVDNLTVGNNANTASFNFTAPADLVGLSWICVADPGATCQANGSGAPSHNISLNGGTGVSYNISGTVGASVPISTVITTTASVSVTTPFTDPASANNTANANLTVVTEGIFANGFE